MAIRVVLGTLEYAVATRAEGATRPPENIFYLLHWFYLCYYWYLGVRVILSTTV